MRAEQSTAAAPLAAKSTRPRSIAPDAAALARAYWRLWRRNSRPTARPASETAQSAARERRAS